MYKEFAVGDEMSDMVDHPFIPNWRGERSWTPPGELQSEFVTFEAGAEGAPFKIVHDRDMMFDHGKLVQDYNSIDYFFGDPLVSIHARHYLLDRHVSVDLPKLSTEANIDDARAAFPLDVLTYLQRRFDAVHVLTRNGYTELWKAG